MVSPLEGEESLPITLHFCPALNMLALGVFRLIFHEKPNFRLLQIRKKAILSTYLIILLTEL